ncbi:MAG: NADH-quinone oxidoreductase subunit C [Saprospiraceae bacterium]|nr:NADH-quinone oxidoreductase subunit C [Saprospiraceae bacterium]MBP7699843.1 NADH-quinone oxidoreductase subunit C [Saprospiraceae bacterium]
MLENNFVLQQIQQRFPSGILHTSEPYGMLTIETTPENIIPLVQYLRDDAALQFIFLTDLCGYHQPDVTDKELGVIYHLHSLVHNFRLRLKVFLPIGNPNIPTLTTLYAGANWMERETFDFYGILFSGHPNLRRILNVDEMDYHPLRKEYKLEDGTRTDKDDRFFGRQGHSGVTFDKRVDRM